MVIINAGLDHRYFNRQGGGGELDDSDGSELTDNTVYFEVYCTSMSSETGIISTDDQTKG